MAKEKKPIEQLPPEYRAIIYTDGSFYPNSDDLRTEGFTGSGIHGYIADINQPEKNTGDRLSNYVITTDGYFLKEENNEFKFKLVLPLCYIDGVLSYLNKGTVSTAEVKAVIEACNYILENYPDVKSIYINSDSEYALGYFQKVWSANDRSDWSHPDMVNHDLGLELETITKTMKSKGMSLELIKVKGHSYNLGNNTADRLASVARDRSKRRDIRKDFHVVDTKDKKYWVIEDDRTPLLKFKQLFFTNTIRAKDDEIIYSILEYPTDYHVGSKTSDCCFGLVIPVNPPDIIEGCIKEYHKLGWYTNQFNAISTMNLNNLYSRNNVHYHKLFGNEIYKYRYKAQELINIDGVPIIHSVRPSGLANQALNNMKALYSIIVDYREFKKTGNNPFKVFQDVTDNFYNINKNKKGDEVYECTLPQGSNFFKLKTKLFNTELVVPIDLGKDTISRNQFKYLEKSKPKVILVLEKRSDKYINYYTIIDTIEGDIGIYCNFYSGRIIL